MEQGKENRMTPMDRGAERKSRMLEETERRNYGR